MPILGNSNDVNATIKFGANTKGIDQAESRLQNFTGNVASTSKRLATIGAGIATGLFGAVAGAGAMGLQVAADVQQATKAYETLLGSADEAKAAIEDVKKDAAKTPFDFRELIQANQMLISTGEGVDESREAVLALGNAIVATGGGNAEFSRMVGNLQQIRNVGTATAADIKQFGFAGINIYEALSRSTGKNIAELKEMDITYDMLTASLQTASEEGGMFANALENQGSGWNLVKSNLMDVVNLMLSDILTDTGIFDALNTGLLNVVNFLDEHKDTIVRFFSVATNAIDNFIGLVRGEDLSMELEEALGFFLGDKAAGVTDFLIGLASNIRTLGAWVAEDKDGIISFLKGVGIALAALAVVGGILQLITLIGMIASPVGLLIIAVGLLYAAWENNFSGIRDIVQGVISFFTETVIPAVTAFVNVLGEKINWLKDNWVQALGSVIGFFATLPLKLPMYMAMAVGKVVEYIRGVDWGRVWNSIVLAFWTGVDNMWASMLDLVVKINAIDWGQMVQDFGKGIGNGLLDLIEGAIQGALSGVPGVGNIKLPRFAEGVTNFGGGLAIVGERGPEIVNLPRGSDVIPNNKIGGMTVHQTNHIYNQIDMTAGMRELGWQLNL